MHSFLGTSGALMEGSIRKVLHVAPLQYETIQNACANAPEQSDILITPKEYDEDLVIDNRYLRLIGDGPEHSVRITGTNAGTKTALTIDGSDKDGDGFDVELRNLNLEGRAGGSGLKVTGLVRRLRVVGCKIHGGDQAVLLDAGGAGGQLVDIIFERCIFANSAIGVKFMGSGGDPHNQIKFIDPIFERITTDCVVNAGGAGAVRDLLMVRPVFAMVDGTEPTRFIDIDDTGNTGLIVDPRFATTVFASAKIAIDAGIMIVGWKTEREVEATDGGTNGRPD